MALGRNHRVFNIGNSSGSYGISRVYHDETLSGDGTLSSLLGVVGGAGDAEVNEFVYNNSGDIINVDNVVQSNSANWDSPDLSEYIKFGKTDISDNDVSATFEVNSGWGVGRPKLVYSAHSVNGFNSNFIWKNGSELLLSANDGESQNRYVNIGKDGIEFSSNMPQASGKYGAEESEYLHSISSTIGDISGDISNKLDASAFDPNEFYPMTGNPSGFLTAVDLSNYYTKNETSGADELASAFANIPAGDAEVNTYVQNNSATINEINTTYQQNSASYLTAHQSLDGYATTAWVEEQGYLTAHQDISNKLDTSAFSDVSGTFLTAVPAGYATTGEVNSVSSILSAAIDAQSGIVYTGIDPIVVNNDDKAISANTWAFSAGNGVSFVDDNVNKITRIDITAQGGNPEVESYVQTNSGAIDDVTTAYQTNSGSYLTAHQDISNKLDVSAFSDVSGDFLTTAFGISESATWNDTSNVVQTNSGSWSFIPTYEYTDNNLISAIDTSGLYATSALESISANILNKNGEIGAGAYYADKSVANHSVMVLNPTVTPFAVTSGIYNPLYYAAGAVTTYGSSSYNTQYFGGFLKGNEWYVSNATAGQALRGETHASRGVHLSGATTAGYSFNLSINNVSGKNDTTNGYNWKLERGCVSGKGTQGEWRYGVEEDTALRTVSALEYNAVDEISGIAGSAIAQYGAEKQWLVHDDTLVHASNSAQYALGVNLSAVAQLLGVDETVLWSGNNFVESGTTAYLSDNIDNYNEVKVCYNPVYTKGIEYQFEVPGSANSYRFGVFSQDTNVYQTIVSLQIQRNEFYIQRSRGMSYNTTNNTWSTRTVSPTGSFAEGIYKIIGIGRKQ